MKSIRKLIIFLILLFFISCGIMIDVASPEQENLSQNYEMINKCKVVPKSGTCKDIRHGYYFDQRERTCKLISYSSGLGCIPPPFKSYEECIACGCK